MKKKAFLSIMAILCVFSVCSSKAHPPPESSERLQTIMKASRAGAKRWATSLLFSPVALLSGGLSGLSDDAKDFLAFVEKSTKGMTIPEIIAFTLGIYFVQTVWAVAIAHAKYGYPDNQAVGLMSDIAKYSGLGQGVMLIYKGAEEIISILKLHSEQLQGWE